MKWLGIAGWAVVIAIAGFAYWNNIQHKELNEFNEAKLAALERENQVLRRTLEPGSPTRDLDKEIEVLNTQLTETQAELKEAQAALASATASSDEASSDMSASAVPENFDPTDLLKSMLDQGDIGDGGSPLGAAMKMFQVEQGEKYADIGAKYAVNMQYADLFKELGLDPEREATMREAINDHMSAMMKHGFKMMDGGEADLEAMAADAEAVQAELDRQMAELLSPEELEQYTAYQEELPRKMMRQSYEMQLGLLAPGLDADARSLVTEAMVDEMVMFNDPGTMPTDIGSVADVQRAAFDRALERLAVDLDDAQMEQVENFIEQQLSFMDIGMEMFGGEAAEAE